MSVPSTVERNTEAICSTYHDAHELLQRIWANRNADASLKHEQSQEDALIEELKASLAKAESSIRSHFERDSVKFGEPYSSGDRMSICTIY